MAVLIVEVSLFVSVHNSRFDSTDINQVVTRLSQGCYEVVTNITAAMTAWLM